MNKKDQNANRQVAWAGEQKSDNLDQMKNTDTKVVDEETVNNFLNPRNITFHAQSKLWNADHTETLKKVFAPHIQKEVFHNVHIVSFDIPEFIKIGYDILQENSSAKILYTGFMSPELYKNHIDDINLLFSYPTVQFIRLPFSPEEVQNIQFQTEMYETIDKEKIRLEHARTMRNLGTIRHIYQGKSLDSLYHPQTEQEKDFVKHLMERIQEYFPWLDTVDKALDYITHITIDIPEVMTGQKISGVYADIDGTILEYVPIWSPKEWQQKLRKDTVDLLKKYESEGKPITLWTGGDVKQKEAYLRSLGITWPVVSKYDYAGATAEIVVDDTDRGAFILQSKILPKTYIDTSKRDREKKIKFIKTSATEAV